MEDFLFKTIAMHAMQGLIAGQGNDSSYRYVNHPDKTKEKQIVDDAMKIAHEMMKRFDEIESSKKLD